MGLDPKEQKEEAEHNFHHLKSRQGIKEDSLIPYAYKTSVAGRMSLRSIIIINSIKEGRLAVQSAYPFLYLLELAKRPGYAFMSTLF